MTAKYNKKMSNSEYEYFKAIIQNKKIDLDTYTNIKNINLNTVIDDEDFMNNLKDFTIKYTNIDMGDKEFYSYIRNKLAYQISKFQFSYNLNHYTKLAR